jgi:hypothetical protein
VGVFTPSGKWSLRQANGTAYRTFGWGLPGDLPVTGDWNGDGVSDLGVWSPGTATFTQGLGRAPTSARGVLRTIRFGNPRR